ncbi:MAG TPA: hypothetical protein VGP82_13790 [Ktedonobacterales bacterium]|jgi:hypothetical protein|nr:hypothetical protein [Ktedonobacterales bacterium]
MPAFGEIVLTPSGSGRVVGVNVPRESVEVMLESGATVTTPLRELDSNASSRPPALQGRDGGANCNTCAHHKAPAAPSSRDSDSLN